MARVIRIRRGFVEWDLAAESAEEALWEVGVRAALVRPGVVTEKIAPVVRGEDINTAYVPNRSKFNVYVYREEIQILTLNPSDVITRDQVRAALNAGKYLELRLKPLLKDVELLLKWLEVLEPEITLFSTPVESPRDVKSPIDIASLLVELTDDESWSRPFVKGMEILVELISSHE
ncbi:MAG: hypothetical protein QXP98_04865 [Thermoproteus sp.]